MYGEKSEPPEDTRRKTNSSRGDREIMETSRKRTDREEIRQRIPQQMEQVRSNNT